MVTYNFGIYRTQIFHLVESHGHQNGRILVSTASYKII
jgi:hypothetical protein